MKKVGIINCYEVSKRCSSSGCLRAVAEATGSFERYRGDDAQLLSFAHCNGCGEDAVARVVARAERMKQVGVDVIHLSTCIRGRCPQYRDFLAALSGRFEVVGYSHGKKSQAPAIEGPIRVLDRRRLPRGLRRTD